MFSINYQSREPIYEQLYSNIVRLISIGVFTPNEKLPTVRALASQLGINPNTVSKAYQMLEQNGYIYSAVGKGSFVADSLKILNNHKEEVRRDLNQALKMAVQSGLNAQEVDSMVKEVYFGGDGK